MRLPHCRSGSRFEHRCGRRRGLRLPNLREEVIQPRLGTDASDDGDLQLQSVGKRTAASQGEAHQLGREKCFIGRDALERDLRRLCVGQLAKCDVGGQRRLALGRRTRRCLAGRDRSKVGESGLCSRGVSIVSKGKGTRAHLNIVVARSVRQV